MSIDEFKTKLQKIEQEAEQNKRRLILQYCRENARFKVGDIVEDHIGKVRVHNIQASYFSSTPVTVYHGRVLKKDGTPTKKEEHRHVYQSNIKDIDSGNG